MPAMGTAMRRAMPRGLYMNILVHRRARLWKRAGLIFIHVPKNGGTSINRALYGQFMGHYSIAEVARWKPDLYTALPSLGITRNPWARLVSAYRFARAGTAMNDGARIAAPARYQIPAFASFERFVTEWLEGRDLSLEDNVFRPQSGFLTRHDGAIGVTHLGRLEEPASYTGFLETVLGQPVSIEWLNRTSDALGYRDAFTPETRDLVAQIYAEDIKRFSYDF